MMGTSKNSQQFKNCFSPASMRLAWERYIRSNQRDGKDYLGVLNYKMNLDARLADLSKDVLSGKYEKNLSKPPKYYKPKPSGTQRTITVLPIEDALVFQAVTNFVATRAYADLNQNKEFVLGSVLSEEVQLGNRLLRRKDPQFFLFEYWPPNYKKFADATTEQFRDAKVKYKLETDLTGFYDTIPNYNLLDVLYTNYRVSGDILDLLEVCLSAWSGTRDGSTPGIGIPQSVDSSHFFANIFLHDVDEQVSADGWSYFRYMDDICIFGYKRETLEMALTKLDKLMKSRGLSLNSSKTSIEKISDDEKKSKVFRSFEYHQEPQAGMEDARALYITECRSDYGVAEQGGAIPEKEDVFGVQQGELQGIFEAELLSLAKRDLNTVAHDIPLIVQDLKSNKDKKKLSKEGMKKVISLCFTYRVAQEVVKNSTGKLDLKKKKLRSSFIFLAGEMFWKIEHFCWIFNYFKNDKEVKKALVKLLEKNILYEWCRAEILDCLTRSQEFSIKELREDFFQQLKTEHSWYVKKSIYRLLLTKCADKQLFKSILASAKKESYGPLKREILYFSDLWAKGGISKEKLAGIFGE